ncbi:hypothetical protein B0H19DRAFT_1064690 [Mycena capillaripes]|nr:hypothetical protein B0H19DRAFT_1064690 [Mycena capillaripes]
MRQPKPRQAPPKSAPAPTYTRSADRRPTHTPSAGKSTTNAGIRARERKAGEPKEKEDQGKRRNGNARIRDPPIGRMKKRRMMSQPRKTTMSQQRKRTMTQTQTGLQRAEAAAAAASTPRPARRPTRGSREAHARASAPARARAGLCRCGARAAEGIERRGTGSGRALPVLAPLVDADADGGGRHGPGAAPLMGSLGAEWEEVPWCTTVQPPEDVVGYTAGVGGIEAGCWLLCTVLADLTSKSRRDGRGPAVDAATDDEDEPAEALGLSGTSLGASLRTG